MQQPDPQTRLQIADMAAFDRPSASAALTKLPVSTTALKVCISRNLSIILRIMLFIETIKLI